MNARSQNTRTRSASTIPAYSSSGRRLRNYSLEAVERFLSATPPTCSVKRNRKTGRICSVQFFPLPQNSAALEGKEPLRKTAHMGQHYSFPQQVDESGRRVWRFAPVLVPRDVDSEMFLMSVFRAVPLSCLKAVELPPSAPAAPEADSESHEPEPPTPANVIEMRPRRPAPVDMPVVRRAA